MLPQEHSCHARFDSPLYLTQGFIAEFGDLAPVIAASALHKIKAERVDAGADYLQVFEYTGRRFWIIDSESYITALLPEEY